MLRRIILEERLSNRKIISRVVSRANTLVLTVHSHSWNDPSKDGGKRKLEKGMMKESERYAAQTFLWAAALIAISLLSLGLEVFSLIDTAFFWALTAICIIVFSLGVGLLVVSALHAMSLLCSR